MWPDGYKIVSIFGHLNFEHLPNSMKMCQIRNKQTTIFLPLWRNLANLVAMDRATIEQNCYSSRENSFAEGLVPVMSWSNLPHSIVHTHTDVKKLLCSLPYYCRCPRQSKEVMMPDAADLSSSSRYKIASKLTRVKSHQIRQTGLQVTRQLD